MYRCVALRTLESGIDPDDAAATSIIARDVVIVLDGPVTTLDGVDVSARIRDPEVAAVVSIIATHSGVRNAMRSQQRAWIDSHGGGVVEGRDIGTVVFPDADVKIYLTASPEERASRRVRQSGGHIAEVAAGIAERDRIDSTRDDSPLRPAPESVVVDSTGRTIEDVVDEIVSIHAARRN